MPDPRPTEHPETFCERCGKRNPSWWVDSEVWNRVVGSPNGILCPTCFVNAAEAAVRARWLEAVRLEKDSAAADREMRWLPDTEERVAISEVWLAAREDEARRVVEFLLRSRRLICPCESGHVYEPRHGYMVDCRDAILAEYRAAHEGEEDGS